MMPSLKRLYPLQSQTQRKQELKVILQNWSDDTPVVVGVDNKSKPRDIKRVGTLVTNRHKNPDILTAGVGLFLWRDEDYEN
jgi:hypothetical protein